MKPLPPALLHTEMSFYIRTSTLFISTAKVNYSAFQMHIIVYFLFFRNARQDGVSENSSPYLHATCVRSQMLAFVVLKLCTPIGNKQTVAMTCLNL
jgi:hypothetical protein